MVDFKSIETFLWVVTLGSFRGAAQRLNTTQPAISQRIAQLEREMGVKLLNRDHRAASPTPSGRQLMVYAEKLIGLRSEMMADVGDRSAMRGVMRLGVAETIVHTWLPRLIKSVNTAYPNLSLEIEVDITPNLSARLLAQEIELAFVVGPLSASGVHNRGLCDYPIGFLASPALGLGGGASTKVRPCAIWPARPATSSTATVSGDSSQLAENVSGEILRSVASSCKRPSASSFSTIAVGITAMPRPSIAMWMTVASEALACSRIGGRSGRLNSERTIS